MRIDQAEPVAVSCVLPCQVKKQRGLASASLADSIEVHQPVFHAYAERHRVFVAAVGEAQDGLNVLHAYIVNAFNIPAKLSRHMFCRVARLYL